VAAFYSVEGKCLQLYFMSDVGCELYLILTVVAQLFE